MSQLESGKASSPPYVYQFAAMTAGTVLTSNVAVTFNATTLANFFPATSRVTGVVRVTSGGVVGQPVLGVAVVANSTTDGYLPQLRLSSSVNTDTSVYAMYWYNEVGSS